MIALQKLRKMFFISSKKLFSFSRYLTSTIASTINLKVYDVINSLNKNFITHFAKYLEKVKRYDIVTLAINRVLNKEHFHGKSCRKCAPKAFPRPLFYFGE